MKILVAEDDRATQMRILAMLREWGHEGVGAGDGIEAWEKFQGGDFAMVISDWLMPRMDGIELLKRVRAFKLPLGYVYLILLTSRSEMDDLVMAMEAGADDFVAKPFVKDELRVRVRAGARILELEHQLERKNRRLLEANKEVSAANERMSNDLKAAARIQQDLLPAALPDLAAAKFAWHYEPCDELGGDLLNIIEFTSSKQVGLYVIDVSGHGVPAALLSVHLSRVLTRLDRSSDAVLFCEEASDDGCRLPDTPATVARRLNQKFQSSTMGQLYFTLTYGIIDLETRQFRYTSAGHPGPILISGQEATFFSPMPPGVGILPDPEFKEQTLDLKRGDRLYLYTDGIYETENPYGDEFGEERLGKILQESVAAGEGLEQNIKHVLNEVNKWSQGASQNDDVSLLAVEIC